MAHLSYRSLVESKCIVLCILLLSLAISNAIQINVFLFLFFTENVKVSPDGSAITIVNARPSNHGAYRCVASNPFGITQTMVSLIVRGKYNVE